MPTRLKVFSTRRLPRAVEQKLRKLTDIEFGDDEREYSADDLVSLAQNRDVLVVTLMEPVTAEVAGKLPETVRLVSTVSAGTDHLDVKALTARGIGVSNTPGAVTDTTAEIAMLLILGAARRAREGLAMVEQDKWRGWRPTQLLGLGLSGAKLGLIGCGRIGQAVATRAAAFGMEVHYHGPREVPGAEAKFHARLETMLELCDVVSLHCPSTPATRGLIDEEHLALCKPGVIIVNTARGDLVNDDALIAALKSGHVAAAGLDVFAGEPQLHATYRSLPNVFALPHLGTATEEARTAMGMLVVDNIVAHADGKPLPNAVKPR